MAVFIICRHVCYCNDEGTGIKWEERMLAPAGDMRSGKEQGKRDQTPVLSST